MQSTTEIKVPVLKKLLELINIYVAQYTTIIHKIPSLGLFGAIPIWFPITTHLISNYKAI